MSYNLSYTDTQELVEQLFIMYRIPYGKWLVALQLEGEGFETIYDFL